MRLQDLFEDQTLLEVNMSPSALRLMASKIDAKAGMEFEIIVTGVNVDDDTDLEPDYDQDETPESIRHICDFFENDDWGVGNNVTRLEKDLRKDFEQWVLEGKFDEAWMDDEYSRVYEWVVNNADEDEIREHLGYEEDEELGKRDYQAYTEYCIEERNDLYEEALDDYRDDFFNRDMDDLEAEWLQEEGYHSMQDVANDYGNTSWPYMAETGNGGEDISAIADEFENIIDRRVKWSSSYHSANRNDTDYIVEPDGSLDPDDQRDGGLEFVSPPLPLNEILSDLRKVVAWCRDRGNYTNDSTGLHMNVSVPGYSLDKLDYVKLALFLGDEYVLKEFGRESNTYCKSALSKIRKEINDENRQAVLTKLSQALNTTASKTIHGGITDKYTSINTKSNYIEFRSPGGDWLNTDIDKLENTLLRFVVALNIAIDPDAYKQEYAKKLYKLLSPAEDGTNTLQLFADYKAGKIAREDLIKNVQSANIQRKLKAGKTTGKLYWWRVVSGTSSAQIEVVAGTKKAAIDVAIEEWGVHPNSQFANAITARPLREYIPQPAPGEIKATVGEPEPVGRRADAYQNVPIPGVTDVDLDIPMAPRRDFNNLSQTDYENRLGWPDQTGDANYEIVNRSNGRREMVFIANTEQDAQRKYNQWLGVAGFPEDTENFGYREINRG